MKPLLAIALLALLSAPAAAQIYKCKGDRGTTIFSDRPCGENAVEIIVEGASRRPPPPSHPEAAGVHSSPPPQARPSRAPSPPAALTASQKNAARSASQYLRMKGFSRNGLIKQLSSEYGDRYSVADSTAAVDSLGVDWSQQATRSAQGYLRMQGFSCQGLISQLSSSHGEDFTDAQASFGARQAGAC